MSDTHNSKVGDARGPNKGDFNRLRMWVRLGGLVVTATSVTMTAIYTHSPDLVALVGQLARLR